MSSFDEIATKAKNLRPECGTYYVNTLCALVHDLAQLLAERERASLTFEEQFGRSVADRLNAEADRDAWKARAGELGERAERAAAHRDEAREAHYVACAKLADAKRERDEAVAVLRELEWAEYNFMQCPCCKAMRDGGIGHDPECKLASIIGKQQ